MLLFESGILERTDTEQVNKIMEKITTKIWNEIKNEKRKIALKPDYPFPNLVVAGISTGLRTKHSIYL